MKTKTQKVSDELRPEYDFDYSKAIRGKYHKRLSEEGANIVVLEPDVAKAFPTEESVNEALRSLINLAQKSIGITSRSSRRAKKLHAG